MTAILDSDPERGWSRWLAPLAPESQSMLHLDALRLIASVGIVLFHLGLPTHDWPALAHVWAWRRDYNLFVDLFFAISGYVICAVYAERVGSWREYRGFLKRRAARLLPLHYATLAAFVVIGLLGHSGAVWLADPSRYDWSCLPAHLAMVQSIAGCPRSTFNFVSWSISAELWIYAAFPLLLLPLRAGRGVLPALTGLTLVVLLAAPPLLGARPFYEWASQGGLVRGVAGFLVGMCLFQGRLQLRRTPAPATLMWILLGVFVIGAAWHWHKAMLLAVIYGVAAMAVAADRKGSVSRPVRWLAPGGQLTFSLYMLHPLLFSIGVGLLGLGVWKLHAAQMRLLIVTCAVILPFVAYASLVWFERPARQWVVRLGRRQTPPPSAPEAAATAAKPEPVV